MTQDGPKPKQEPKPGSASGRRVVLAGLAGLACGALLLSACTTKPQVQSSQSATVRELVFARTADATSTTLANAYVGMLEAAGIQAKVGEPVADPVAEVLDGKADAVVAGSGDLLAALDKQAPAGSAPATGSGSPSAPATGSGSPSAPTPGTVPPPNAEQVLKALHGMDLGGFALLDSAEATRTGTLVVTAATSAGMNLSTLAQLPALCPELDLGVPKPLSAGLLPVLEDIHACKPHHVVQVVPQDEAPVGPLITGQVQVLATTSDNAGIQDNGLVPVQDAQTLFTPQTLTPLTTTRQIGQDAIDAMNKVSAALKQEDLIALNRAVTGRDALSPEQAARDWLREKSLVAAP
ncbi:glycine betaine ABC transporter substrate-binding protein [Paeniglutamicibacter sp. NPDC012692]|uniref:glycine betaine ABC transporter substrate-binding protein n=1 Tax=Paeniglutamicibacter sp. NPDC012692 TaxID=3364388 RepID=UPI0036BF33D4